MIEQGISEQAGVLAENEVEIADELKRLLERRRYEELLARWRQAHDARLTSKSADFSATHAALALGDAETASRILAHARELYGIDSYLMALSSELSKLRGDWCAAYSQAAEASSLDPRHIYAAATAGQLAIQLRDFDAAYRHFKYAIDTFMEAFDPHSIFPLECLMKIHAITGSASRLLIDHYLRRLASLGHLGFVEVSPFLARAADMHLSDRLETVALGLVGTDPRARMIYGTATRPKGELPGYGLPLEDCAQHHLVLKDAIVSASCGAVLDGGTCFVIDHGYHSPEFLAEFSLDSKLILTQDENIHGFCLRDRTVHLAAERQVRTIDAEVLVIAPCHPTNLGHFVHDVLLLKYGFDRIRQGAPNVQPLVLRRFPNPAFERLFVSSFDRPYILMDDDRDLYRFRAVHLLTLPHGMWPRRAKICIDPTRYLLSHLRTVLAPPPSTPRQKLFIARRDGDPLSERLQATFESLGFTPVHPEDLTGERYFHVLGAATHLAGLHGAGLMNMAFGASDLRVAEIRTPARSWHSIATFAVAGDIDFQSFDLDPTDPAEFDALRERLVRWLAAVPGTTG